MKIDRHSRTTHPNAVKLGRMLVCGRLSTTAMEAQNSQARCWLPPLLLRIILSLAFTLLVIEESFSQQPSPVTAAAPAAASETNTDLSRSSSQLKATALLQHTIDRLANGPAFNATVRQRVWAFGREVFGIGTYEQAGHGSGRFNLQLAMLDGAGKHTLQQISDGRLAWTRTTIADKVSLRRVDVGRLDEWIPLDRRTLGQVPITMTEVRSSEQIASQNVPSALERQIPPRLKVGAWTELLDTIQRDHTLRLGSSTVDSRPVLVITGTLKESVRNSVLDAAGQQWPEMYPTMVKIAIATTPDPQTGFGEGLPIRFEFWGDPISEPPKRGEGPPAARLLTLIEIYAIHPMSAPPLQRFRFENQDSDVNFVNETDRYLHRYGVHITDSQRRLLLR